MPLSPPLLQAFGALGNFFLVIAYLPQIVKIVRTKRAEDLSMLMWLCYFFGDALLLIYAMMTGDTIFTMLFSFFMIGNLTLMVLTYKFGRISKTVMEKDGKDALEESHKHPV